MIEFATEPVISGLVTHFSETIANYSPEVQLKMIAIAVAKLMGGPIDPDEFANYNFKFKISELKLSLGSNVIPIGMITQGTFYHRALLFKAICDRLTLKPCSLARGDYNRAWNVVDVKNQSIGNAKPIIVKKERLPLSAKAKGQLPVNNPAPATAQISSDWKSQYLGNPEVEAEPYLSDEPAIVDLMFNPGKLLPVDTPEAVAYKRIMKEMQ